MNEEQNEPMKVVTAQAFRVVDKEGNQRGYFGLDPDGHSALLLHDKSGKMRLRVRLGDEGEPCIELDAADDSNRIGLSVSADGNPRLWMRDGEVAAPRIGLQIDDEGVASLDLWSRNEETGISAYAYPSGEMSLGFWKKGEETPRVSVRVQEDGTVIWQGIHSEEDAPL